MACGGVIDGEMPLASLLETGVSPAAPGGLAFIDRSGAEGEGGGSRIRGFTRFERARIIGARALQIAMGAPVILAIPPDLVDPVDIAELEFEKGLIPITVRRET